MSPIDFLLLNKNKENFVENCNQLFTDPELNPTWQEAIDACKEYRRYLRNTGVDPILKIKSYVLRREDIQKLLSQAEPGLDGIRIYLGHQIVDHGDRVIRVFGVGCKKNGSGGYDDVIITPRSDEKGLIEGRPCPRECSNDNELNSGDA